MYFLQIKTNVHDASYYQQEDYALVSIVASAACNENTLSKFTT